MAPHWNTAVCDITILFAAPALPALPQVAYKYGVDTHNLLKEAGADITFKTYHGMAHSVSGGGIWSSLWSGASSARHALCLQNSGEPGAPSARMTCICLSCC